MMQRVVSCRGRWPTIVLNTKPASQWVSSEPDKIIRKLENFPELAEALRNGDRVTARLLFAQLFDADTEDMPDNR